MPTIEIDEVTYQWIQDVRKERGIVGYDHGKPRQCDNSDAILEMHVAYIQMKKVKEALR